MRILPIHIPLLIQVPLLSLVAAQPPSNIDPSAVCYCSTECVNLGAFRALQSDLDTCSARTCPVVEEDLLFNTRYRSTIEILWSCLAIIFASSWVCVHPNVTGYNSTMWTRLWARLRLFALAIFAPEVLAVFAYFQWKGSRELYKEFRDRATALNISLDLTSPCPGIKTNRENESAWTLTHAHFIQMGGVFFTNSKPIVDLKGPQPGNSTPIIYPHPSVSLPSVVVDSRPSPSRPSLGPADPHSSPSRRSSPCPSSPSQGGSRPARRSQSSSSSRHSPFRRSSRDSSPAQSLGRSHLPRTPSISGSSPVIFIPQAYPSTVPPMIYPVDYEVVEPPVYPVVIPMNPVVPTIPRPPVRPPSYSYPHPYPLVPPVLHTVNHQEADAYMYPVVVPVAPASSLPYRPPPFPDLNDNNSDRGPRLQSPPTPDPPRSLYGTVAGYKKASSWSDEEIANFFALQLSEDAISDKSKGSALAKLLVVGQVLWFVIQTCARWYEGLPITHLEVVCVAFVAFNIAMYACWWNKPLDVAHPSVVPGLPGDSGRGTVITDILVDAAMGRLGLIPVGRWSYTRGSSRYPDLYCFVKGTDPRGSYRWGNDKGLGLTFTLLISISSSCFGALHAIGWSLPSPSPVEQILWRVSCLVLVAFPILAFLAPTVKFLTCRAGIVEVLIAVIMIPGGYAYIAARLILLVLPFIELRALPPLAHQTISWSNFIPHI